MNAYDMLRLFGRPMTPNPKLVKEAERVLTQRDRDALDKAEAKRARKRALALRS